MGTSDFFKFDDIPNTGKPGKSAIGEIVTIRMPRESMREMIVLIASNIARIQSVLIENRKSLGKYDIAELESVYNLGSAMVRVLSVASGFSQKELEDELDRYVAMFSEQELQVHFNKSNEKFDELTRDIFGKEGT